MSEDNSDIAFLAAFTEREMRQKLLGSSSLRYNRTDFRQFLNNNQGQIQPHPQMVPPLQNPYPSYPPSDPYQVPDGIIPQNNPQLLPLPAQYTQQVVNPNIPQIPSSPQTYEGFNIPDYNAKNNPQQKQYLEDEAEFRAALIKEVKSLKNTIKDLKKQVSSFIVSITPLIKSSETNTNENTTPSEGIHIELHQSD